MPIPRKLSPDEDAKDRIWQWAKMHHDEYGPCEQEHVFAKAIGRKWRFDFAWPDAMLAVEFEGAVYTGGRHTRGAGFEKDAEKYATALIMGWRVLRVTTGLVLRKDRIVFKWLKALLEGGT